MRPNPVAPESPKATYYVDSVEGNDSATGIAIDVPFKTLTKLNSASSSTTSGRFDFQTAARSSAITLT